jgi:hypothetical protein
MQTKETGPCGQCTQANRACVSQKGVPCHWHGRHVLGIDQTWALVCTVQRAVSFADPARNRNRTLRTGFGFTLGVCFRLVGPKITTTSGAALAPRWMIQQGVYVACYVIALPAHLNPIRASYWDHSLPSSPVPV